ncbi:MAG: LuxR C-terminal-related transcriptional regulator [Pseudonocardia sp.]
MTRFLHRITADPSAPLTAAIVGPGGTGKTMVLDAVAHAYRGAGIDPLHVGIEQARSGEGFEPGKVALIDDAHRLDAQTLGRLRAFAEADDTRVIVAYRPWSGSRSLSTLSGRAARQGATVVVGHLERAAIATRVAGRLGATPPESLIDLVHEQSGGLPVLVDIVVRALVDGGRYDPSRPGRFRRPERITVSTALAERLRHYIDALDPGVHSLMEAMAVGATLETEVLMPLVDVAPEELVRTVEAARATGLLTENGELIPFVRNLLLRLTPVLRTREMQRRLAGIQLDRGGSILEVGRQMLGTGASGSRAATIFEAAGDEALRSSPALAADLFAGAVEAGAPSSAVAARRCRGVALTGDLSQALQLADEVISDPSAPHREQALVAAAAALAHRGLLPRSADLLRCLHPNGAVLAVPALIGTGELDDARAILDAVQPGGSSSLLDGAGIMMAHAMVASVTGSAPTALSKLVRASVLLEPIAETALLPDTPAALTAVVALHCGELAVAEAALQRGAAGRHGGKPAQIRHLLLHGWLAMVRGQLDTARRALEHSKRPGLTLEPRDELFATALAVAIERRCGDATALASAWSRARTALVHHPVDLFMLLPLGELAVAAAQLGQRAWIASQLDDAWQLLTQLGEPELWTAPLHWSELQAAVISGRHPEAKEHAAALADAESSSPYIAVLAAAATSWTQVRWEEIDPDAVQAAARGLHGLGLRWEGANLAGWAAARATDRRAVAALHTCARSLFPSSTVGETLSAAAEPGENAATLAGGGAVASAPVVTEQETSSIDDAPPRPPVNGDSVLTGRELEIGQLILAGLTHKQIGQRLFISAKTVEHHVARMRQRLGVGSRTELFGRLRVLLDEPLSAAG